MVWTRRGALRGGEPLYAPQAVCKCPEFVMATLAELAEHGIAGSADVLPVPAVPAPQVDVLPLGVAVELNDLRTRLAGMANPPREVFLALYDGAEPELFATVEAARACCDDLAKTDAHGNYWDWTVNEYGVHVQFWTHPDDDRPLSETSGSVTTIVVQGDEPLSELERLRARVAELEAQHEALAERLRAGQRWQRGRNPELVSENFVSQSELRSIFGIRLTAPWDEDPAMPAEADGIVRRIAPVQAYREDDPFGLHHTYRVPRDLPEIGGAR
ncbi:hypothetical protein [Streptomyces spiralis]|uniref:hypothetical protein n=1 Tax=Streptomyces spiralis TaxID=66376 RepID=UPI0036A05ADC